MSSNYRSHIILVLPIEMHLTAHYLFSPGTFARQAIGESLSAYKKEDSGQFVRLNILATRNYWQTQTYHRCTTDDYRILLSSCMYITAPETL